MKYLLITVGFIALGGSASAATKVDLCNALEEMAMSIMEARQTNIPMSKIYEITKDNPITKSLTIAAYDLPRFSTEEYQQNSINDFGSKAFKSCISEVEA